MDRFDGLTTNYSAVLEKISAQKRDEEKDIFILHTLTQYSVSKGLRIFGKEVEKAVIKKSCTDY